MTTLAKIKELVCSHYGVTIIDLDSDRQGTRIVTPRHVAMYLGRELTPHSAAVIGKQFGGKDHTTVLSAARKIRIAQYGDDDLSRSIGAIKRILVESEAVIPDAEWPA